MKSPRTRQHVLAAKTAVFKQIYANLASGFLVSVFEADSKEKLEEQMEILGFPIDETHEVHFSASQKRNGANGQTRRQS